MMPPSTSPVGHLHHGGVVSRQGDGASLLRRRLVQITSAPVSCLDWPSGSCNSDTVHRLLVRHGVIHQSCFRGHLFRSGAWPYSGGSVTLIVNEV